MTGEQVAAMEFTDGLTGAGVFANVRIGRGCVGVTLSLRHDGDVEVFFRLEDCEALVAALQRALSELRGSR